MEEGQNRVCEARFWWFRLKWAGNFYLRELSNNFYGDHALREKSPNTKFFLVLIFPYSVQMRESTDGKKFRIWTFSRSAWGLIIESRLFIRSELYTSILLLLCFSFSIFLAFWIVSLWKCTIISTSW